jgi:MoaA/NifB/PqqE/SkfB family radical SAM enzyme
MDLSFVGQAALARLLGRARPLAVGFEITHRCNLRCSYCDRNRTRGREMSQGEIFRILHELRAAGMRALSLDGGEPLMHPDVDAVIAYLADHGVVLRINTNGVLVPRHRDAIRRIAKVKISLDGPAEVHDAARGSGAFESAVCAIDIAREQGCEVELTCVLGPHNTEHVEDVLQIADRLGVSVVFQPVRDSLLATGRTGLAGAAIARIRRALACVTRCKRAGSRVANGWASLRHYQAWPDDASIPCAAGWINATVDAAGKIFACGQADRRSCSANVLELGAARAFEQIDRNGCRQCWCARVVEENYAWGGLILAALPLDLATPP